MDNKFKTNIDWFVKNIESRKNLLPVFAHASGSMTKNVSESLEKFIDTHAYEKTYDESGELLEFAVPQEYGRRYQKLKRSLQHSLIFTHLLPNMALISLISLYDAYIGRLIRTYFEVKPDTLKGSQKQLSFSELSEFESIDDAKEYLICLEIESLLRDNHDEQFNWIEKKIGVSLRKDLPAWNFFIELTERRNLLVHADGIVSKNYLKICKEKNLNIDSNLKIGSKLEITPEYYINACNCVAEIGIKLAQVMWRKLLPEEANEADTSLISVSYDFLCYQEYELALVVTKFSDIPAIKNSCLENTLYLKINQAIAKKALDDEAGCKLIIESVDWSACSEMFKLAVAVLTDKWDTASDIMKEIGSESKKVGKFEYREWPLFKWFRKTENFKEAYKSIFGEDFKILGNTQNDEIDTNEPTEQVDKTASQTPEHTEE